MIRILSICFSITLLTACYKNESSQQNSLVYCSEKFPQSFNPQVSHDVASLDATTHQLYNRLLKFDPVTNELVGDLALRWKVNKDNSIYTFDLRRYINFHHSKYFTPTRHLNADDVIFSFERLFNSNHPYHAVNRASDEYFFNHPFSQNIKQVIKLDTYRLQIQLHKPDATLLASLAAHYAVILSKEYAQQLLLSGHPEQLDFKPIGTGPYKYKN